MNPIVFEEANCQFGPPADMEESQVQSVFAYEGTIDRGSVEGSPVVVVCWEISAAELERLIETRKLFISFMGGLPGHFPSLSFKEATSPS